MEEEEENTKIPLAIVVACSSNLAIGKAGVLPWRIPDDVRRFRIVTSTTADADAVNAVIMGRRTWESIPNRPLPGRVNVVLTSSDVFPDGVLVASSLQEALKMLEHYPRMIETVFVIGGSALFAEAVNICDKVYWTKITAKSDDAIKKLEGCDTFFPVDVASDERFACVEESRPRSVDGFEFKFMTFCRATEERQYLNLVKHIIDVGVLKGDRTGVGTYSVFGRTMRFSLRGGTMPLFTTKKVFWRGVAEELLWFISGDTNVKTLKEKNVHIWDENGSREFLDKRGLRFREEGDLGPVYGFQWRHFGAQYTTCHADYKGKGIDQIKQIIDTIKKSPDDRRLILSAWNPSALPDMALPPCHMFAQFYVARGELSCQMYQRSADMGLGVPFNVASYALLTHLIAHCTDLLPGEFIHVMGDCHVYTNHVAPLREQLKREPRPFPKLRIKNGLKDIDGFKFEDFEIVGYNPYPAIKMEMAV